MTALRIGFAAAALWWVAGSAEAQTDSARTRLWVAGETDAPVFCLILSGDGTARFAGGYLWLNPMRWHINPKGELSLSVPHLDSSTASVLRTETRAVFDSVRKTVTYRFVNDSTLWFGGYALSPVSGTDSVPYSIARRRCGLPRRR